MTSITIDLCVTPGCSNPAVPGQKHCTACISQLADSVDEPAVFVPGTYPGRSEDLERAYVGLVVDVQHEDPQVVICRQQQVLSESLALIENMEAEIAHYQRQLSLAESRERGLEEQVEGLRQQVTRTIEADATRATQRNGGQGHGLLRALRRLLSR